MWLWPDSIKENYICNNSSSITTFFQVSDTKLLLNILFENNQTVFLMVCGLLHLYYSVIIHSYTCPSSSSVLLQAFWKIIKYLINESKDLYLISIISRKTGKERGVHICGESTVSNTEKWRFYRVLVNAIILRGSCYGTPFAEKESGVHRDLVIYGDKWYFNLVVCNSVPHVLW